MGKKRKKEPPSEVKTLKKQAKSPDFVGKGEEREEPREEPREERKPVNQQETQVAEADSQQPTSVAEIGPSVKAVFPGEKVDDELTTISKVSIRLGDKELVGGEASSIANDFRDERVVCRIIGQYVFPMEKEGFHDWFLVVRLHGADIVWLRWTEVVENKKIAPKDSLVGACVVGIVERVDRSSIDIAEGKKVDGRLYLAQGFILTGALHMQCTPYFAGWSAKGVLTAVESRKYVDDFEYHIGKNGCICIKSASDKFIAFAGPLLRGVMHCRNPVLSAEHLIAHPKALHQMHPFGSGPE